MRHIGWLLVVPLLLAAAVCGAQQRAGEDEAVWAREKAYWQFVETNDLVGYRSLWREDFLGWPLSSSAPARKAQITDWITAQTSKGGRLKSYALERLAVQVSGDMATTTYRARITWVNKEGVAQSGTMRVLHTWRRADDGSWRIFSGMSAPVNGEGR